MLLLIASRDAAVGGTYSIRPGTSYGDEIGFRYSSWIDPGGDSPLGPMCQDDGLDGESRVITHHPMIDSIDQSLIQGSI